MVIGMNAALASNGIGYISEESYKKQGFETIEQLNEAVLNEVYFGEKPLAGLFKQFSKFRDKYIGKSWNPKINVDPDLIKFNRMVEDQFGYYKFCINIDPSYSYNAAMFDIGVGTPPGFDKKLEEGLRVYKSNKGFYFDKSAGVVGCAYMLMGLIADKDFTDRELLAVLLHEIGHNFTKVVLTKKTAPMTRSNALMAAIVATTKKAKENVETVNDMSDERIESDINSIRFLDKAKQLIGNVKEKLNPMNFVHSVVNTAKGMASNMKHYDYTNEKFADSFASMYGYGADGQSAISKMTSKIYGFYTDPNQKPPSNISIALKVADITFNNWIRYLLGTLDEHPNDLARIKTQIEYLERELRNESLDPAMKQELEKQLAIQKGLIDDYLESTKNRDQYTALRRYYAKLYKKYGGDYREKDTDNNAMYDKIDQVYNDLVNSQDESTIFMGNLISELLY